MARVEIDPGAFAAALYLNHLVLSVAFGPRRAVIAGATLAAIWSSTVVILHRFDRVFASRFEPEHPGTI